MKRYLILILVVVLVLTSGLWIRCSQPTTTPTIPSASPRVTQDWQSYDNESLGIAFRYPETYTLLLDDPINSGIQLESESISLAMIANPLSGRSVEMLAEELPPVLDGILIICTSTDCNAPGHPLHKAFCNPTI